MALPPKYKGWHWSTRDASNPTLVAVLDDTSKQLHFATAADAETDWAVSAATHPTLFIHSETTPSTDYLKIGDHDGTEATIDVVGGTTLDFDIAGTTVVTVINSAGLIVADGQGIVVGDESQETISDGGGDTDVVPEVQILGTTQADSTLMIAQFNATNASGPMLAFVKSGDAAIDGSHVTVADNEYLGRIVAFGDDGTDLESPAAEIRFVVDDTPATGEMGGSIEFYTTADGGETLTACATFDVNQDLLSDDAGGYALMAGAASTTAPTLCPDRASTTTGLGGNASTSLDVIVNGNRAFYVEANGELFADVDADGGAYLTNGINLFDEYDDAVELQRFAYTTPGVHLVAPEVTEDQRMANRERMVELGVFERDPDFPSGMKYRRSAMDRLLAGGIYQNRWRMDGQYDALDKRIASLEAATA